MRLLKVVKDAITEEQQREVMIRCMDIILDRLTNAWKLQDKVLHKTCNPLYRIPRVLGRQRGNCIGTQLCCAQVCVSVLCVIKKKL